MAEPAAPSAANTTRLADADALIWAVERDPRLASTISSAVVFDTTVDPEALRARLERTTRVVLRMRQRVVGNPVSLSPPRWELDPAFDLDNHLTVADAPGDTSMRAVLDDAATFIAEPFDRDHPLFSFVLFQGVRSGLPGTSDEHSVLVMKAHHAIADGLGMLQIQVEFFDFEPDTADPELPDAPDEAPLSASERLGNALEYERVRTVGAARNLAMSMLGTVLASDQPLVDQSIDALGGALRALQPAPPMSPVLTGRSSDTWYDIIALSLPDLKKAGKRAGTKMNAAFVAGVARGMGMFHEQVADDEPACRLLRMGMPISVRSDPAGAGDGNHVAPIRIEIPLDADEPDHLIRIVDALVAAERDDPVQSIVGPAQQLLARLPSRLAGLAFAHVLKGSDFLTSNVPGSPVPMYLGPAEVLAQFPLGPTSAAAVNVTLLSYQDEVHIGVSIDAAATDQPQTLAACIRKGLDWAIQV